MALAASGRGQIHDSVPIEPGEHEIAASVQATFELEPVRPAE
jgi:uncharacterized protein YggE